MSEKLVTKGIVLRATATKEADYILNILTDSLGRIAVVACGARRKGSRIAAGSGGTVVLTLAYENQNIAALLDIPIVKAGTETATAPIGTGPYVYTAGESGSVSLTRNVPRTPSRASDSSTRSIGSASTLPASVTVSSRASSALFSI